MHETPYLLIKAYAKALQDGNIAELKKCFKEDATIVGTQDGVYVKTDLPTFIRFMKSMGLGTSAHGSFSAQIIWDEVKGNVAVTSIVEWHQKSPILSYMIVMRTSDGWTIITRSFLGYEGHELSIQNTTRKIRH